jgi:hypothetical protein
LEPNSKASYDATDANGKRIQINARRITPKNPQRMLGVIRNFEGGQFDELVAVFVNDDYEVIAAISILHDVVDKSRYYAKVNGNRLVMNDALLNDPRVTKLESVK